MKKGACRKVEIAAASTKNIRPKKLNLKPSRSQDSLLDRSDRNAPKRKASTPTNDRTAMSVSPDISRIITNGSNPDKNHLMNEEKPPKGKLFQKPVAPKETDLQERLDLEYTRYIQAVFKNKLQQATIPDIDDEMTTLQKRIAENERILHKTTERLKNIKFNKEVDLIYKLHNPNYGNVLEGLDGSNCEEHLTALNKKMAENHNQLRVKNIEVPQGGGAQLMSVITETLAAFEKMKTNQDVETPKVLAEINSINRSTASSLSRCKESLSTAEDLLLTRATLELCARNDK